MMPCPYQAGDLIEWSEVDYVAVHYLDPAVRGAMEHIGATELRVLAAQHGVRIGEIFTSQTPVRGVAGAITYRAWSFVEGAECMGEGYE
jgi:hypothetical protein